MAVDGFRSATRSRSRQSTEEYPAIFRRETNAERGLVPPESRRELFPSALLGVFLFSMLSVCLVFTGVGRADVSTGVGQRLPELNLTDMQGQPLSLAGLAGKVTLINIWGTWCRPCREEMPFLSGLAERYRAQGLRIIGVAQDEDRREVQKFLRRSPTQYTIAVDTGHAFVKRLDVVVPLREMPRSVLVDRTGVIRYAHVSRRAADLAALQTQIETQLRQP